MLTGLLDFYTGEKRKEKCLSVCVSVYSETPYTTSNIKLL